MRVVGPNKCQLASFSLARRCEHNHRGWRSEWPRWSTANLNLVTKDGAWLRQHFFGKYPELLDLVSHLSDDQLTACNAADMTRAKFTTPTKRRWRPPAGPPLLLAHTVKGYGLGEAGEGRNITHQQKKLNEQEIEHFKSRFEIPIPGRRGAQRGALQAARRQPRNRLPS